MSFIYAAEALFFLGIAIWLIRWVGRTLRDISSPPAEESLRTAAMERLLSEGLAARAAAERSGAAREQETGAAVTVHCPACGTRIVTERRSLPIAADCSGCGRRVNARGDGHGRMSVVVVDAPPRA